jgi:hypothetical protein
MWSIKSRRSFLFYKICLQAAAQILLKQAARKRTVKWKAEEEGRKEKSKEGKKERKK